MTDIQNWLKEIYDSSDPLKEFDKYINNFAKVINESDFGTLSKKMHNDILRQLKDAKKDYIEASRATTSLGRGKAMKVIKINFPIDTIYNTAQKRLRFVRKFGEPLGRQHKSVKYYKYILDKENPKKKVVRKKIEGVWLHIEL